MQLHAGIETKPRRRHVPGVIPGERQNPPGRCVNVDGSLEQPLETGIHIRVRANMANARHVNGPEGLDLNVDDCVSSPPAATCGHKLGRHIPPQPVFHERHCVGGVRDGCSGGECPWIEREFSSRGNFSPFGVDDMYHLAPNDSDPRPLDFNAPERANVVADAFDPDACPREESPVPTLDTAALLAEIGLTARAIREVQHRWSAPDV